jgi:hypothetical protein
MIVIDEAGKYFDPARHQPGNGALIEVFDIKI